MMKVATRRRTKISAWHGLLSGVLWGLLGLVAAAFIFAPASELAFAETHSPDNITVHLDRSDIPVAVRQAVPSVVALQRLKAQSATGQPNGLLASGVLVGDGQILTAAHTFSDGQATADWAASCRQTVVEAAGKASPAANSRDNVVAGSARYQRTADGRGMDGDIALLTAQASPNLRQLPAVKLLDGGLRKGDSVYFVNYQAAADGQRRSPQLWDARTAGSASDRSQPVIFRGVVLSLTRQGYMVATNLDSSNQALDRVLRKGGSGGAVLTADGRLAGLSVATTSLTADRSALALERQYGVQLPAGAYQVARVQAVSADALRQLQSRLQACR